MIGVIFMFASEMVEVRVDGNHILFRSGVGPQWSTIDGLQLNYGGVCKEFPDLKGESTWREQAIARFNEKVSEFDNDKDRIGYIIEDLRKHGYVAKYIQKGGHRVKRIKDDKWRELI